MDVIRYDVVQQALIMRDHHDRAARIAQLVDAVRTARRASISSPLSVSSKIARRGSSIAIWKISLRFFSPPENPRLTGRCSRSSPISSSFSFALDRLQALHRVQFRLAPAAPRGVHRGAQEIHVVHAGHNEGSFGLLMDPMNGAADIESRTLRLVSNYGFLEEPSLLIRATRYRTRLGWEMDPKTQTRYMNAKEEGVIERLSTQARKRELEQIGHEEEGLKVFLAGAGS